MDIPALLVENIVQGFVIGLIIGLVLKMASKAVRNLLIIQFVLIKWLEARNIVIIDWNRLTYGLLGKEELVVDQTVRLVESLVEAGCRRLPLSLFDRFPARERGFARCVDREATRSRCRTGVHQGVDRGARDAPH